ncbi:hypothetical protein CERSUDRAFT_112057 [Gelatoporia subvermispora B]|uniref:YTH domain-containing protein n=1 Tax=Ceriporiopsis subvermispora (strain B) TaxID=914234 RepID=M2R5C6_CERS8|nr:hypothetical protein CERSUDRAFT_112057 [Gelatoporia subvermispora B]
MTSREVESYSQPGPSSIPSMHYPMSPRSGPVHYATSHTHAPESHSTSPVQSTSAGTGTAVPRGKPPEAGQPPEPPSSVASSSRSVPVPSTSDRPPTRRPYHPNPPTQRSEWVMWAGNVPSDATHDELWRFFNQPPSPALAAGGGGGRGDEGDEEEPLWGGVSSIFLISRSNCAFVNFESEAHLHAAIQRFNGRPLRPDDLRCPRLVCRVRSRNDDLKAGVGGQRGAGIHVRWIREQKEKAQEEARRRSTSSSDAITTPSSSPSDIAPIMTGLSIESDDEGGLRRVRRPEPHSSSSGSHASTNSSILQQYFPKRYFILKSLTQFDLDLSVEKGLWATQKHNEGILDQAYRTSKDVYLIFGVNKSGEFYGYARMVGPILRGEHRVSWASRTDSPPQRRSSQPSSMSDSPPTTRRDYAYFGTPDEHRQYGSPLPVSPDPLATLEQTPRTEDVPVREHLTAPAEMHQPHHRLSRLTIPHPEQNFDSRAATFPTSQLAKFPSDTFELDPRAPARNLREHNAPVASGSGSRAEWEPSSATTLAAVKEEDEKQAVSAEQSGEPSQEQPREEGPVWGSSFKVEWIRTHRLPFHRTRHLRNPWNHDREVKVSRDGTELEPSVGQALLEEWDRPDPSPAASPTIDRRPASARVPEESSYPPAAGEG